MTVTALPESVSERFNNEPLTVEGKVSILKSECFSLKGSDFILKGTGFRLKGTGFSLKGTGFSPYIIRPKNSGLQPPRECAALIATHPTRRTQAMRARPTTRIASFRTSGTFARRENTS